MVGLHDVRAVRGGFELGSVCGIGFHRDTDEGQESVVLRTNGEDTEIEYQGCTVPDGGNKLVVLAEYRTTRPAPSC